MQSGARSTGGCSDDECPPAAVPAAAAAAAAAALWWSKYDGGCWYRAPAGVGVATGPGEIGPGSDPLQTAELISDAI